MDGDVIDSLAKAFFALMDNKRQDWMSILHEDAVLDWFGRCVVGANQIKTFVRGCIDQTSHTITSIKSCSPIKHRRLKQASRKRSASPTQEQERVEKSPVLVECGQGDGWGMNVTPPNRSIPHEPLLLKAPKRKMLRDCKIDKNEQLYFLKISGNLHLLHKTSCDDGDSLDREKMIKHIIIAYTNGKIKLIVYEGNTICKRLLMNEYQTVDSLLPLTEGRYAGL